MMRAGVCIYVGRLLLLVNTGLTKLFRIYQAVKTMLILHLFLDDTINVNHMRLKKIIGNGLLLAIPLGTIIYIFIKLVKMLIVAISPLASDLGIEKILGELTLTILAVFVMLLIIFFLGLLMQISTVAGFGKRLEEIAFKLFPSLNQVKALAAEKLEFSNQSAGWKATIIYYEEKYSPAYLVEENEKLVTFFVLKGTTLQDGEILITDKSAVKIIEITPKQLHQYSRQFGQGFLSVIK